MKKKILIGLTLLVMLAGTACSAKPGPVTPALGPTPSSTPTSQKVIEITAQELIFQLQANPNKYKEGTIFRISGTIIENGIFAEYLGTEVNGWKIILKWNVGDDAGLGGIRPGTEVIVQGKYDGVMGQIVLFENCFLVSRN